MNQVVVAKSLEEYKKLLKSGTRYIEYPYAIKEEIFHFLSNNIDEFKDNKWYMYEYCKMLITSPDYCTKEEGKKIIIDLAKENNEEAWNLLGEYYKEDINLYDKCFICYLNAATRSSAKAMVNIGYLYLNGRFLPQNVEMAIFWFEKAAKEGYSKAFSILGNMYKDGNGVEVDIEKARYWYTKGDEAGDAESMFHIADMLYAS